MRKIERVEKYINDFSSGHWEEIDTFFWSSHRNRHYEVYPLKNGTKIMDFIISVHGNIEEMFNFEHLVPQKFTTADSLFTALNSFKDFIIKHQGLLDENLDGEDTWYAVSKMKQISKDLIEMIDHSKQIYDVEDTVVPYQDLRYYLITGDVPEFIKLLKSIFASVSYAIMRKQEGYYHSIVHVILKLLGFDIVSEELTNKGRIDAVIRFIDMTYILEFKFSENADESGLALSQIKEKGYSEKYYIEKKDIYGIGISFGEHEKNINGFQFEKLV